MKKHVTHATIITLFITLIMAAGAFAQTSQPCATGKDLPRIPELQSKDGKLRGTIVVVAETANIGTRNPATAPTSSATEQCFPQTIRAMKGIGTDVPYPPTPPDKAADPMPGPTLRARVGELVELTFLNQIDMNRFPKSLDQGQCDSVTGVYPSSTSGTDEYPNCFHGSTTANIHFHGTHVNPDTTGDNVFVEIRPSLRTRNEANAPLVTRESVKQDFETFFNRCEQELVPAQPVKQWPRIWADFPKHFTEKQELLLKRYDSEILGEKNRNLWLWPVDRKQRDTGRWPQYYVGAFPYCFRIPMYTETTFPPPANATHAVHAQGKGSAESNHQDDRPLMMGQAPGTHWYHAHKHGSTTIDVSNGMVGAFIIEGKYDEDLNAYYGNGWTRQQKVMVINQLGVSPNLERNGKGQDKGATFSVNGAFMPVVHMRPGEVQMWRIVNASSRAGVYVASFPTGFQWRQLAQDGVQFVDANYQASGKKPLLLAAGNRADLLVMAPADATASPVALQVQYEVDPSDLKTAALNTLLQITVDNTTPASGNQATFIPNAPSFPPFLADVKESEIQGTKRIVFASQSPRLGPQHTIDGKQFGGEVGAVVLLNQAEEWTVVNETYGPLISHPFHIHLNPFQITELFDPNATVPNPDDAKTPLNKYVFTEADKKTDQQCVIDVKDQSTWKNCTTKPLKNGIWWDVFPIPSGRAVKQSDGTTINIPGYFKMRSRFVDYSGFYVIHCHILAHEDRGMMTIVEVAPLQSPYSHH